MKRLAAVLIIICALSVPSFAGHIPAGGYRCNCNSVLGVCPCCGGTLTVAGNQEDEPICEDFSDGAGSALDPGFIRLAFLAWLKLAA